MCMVLTGPIFLSFRSRGMTLLHAWASTLNSNTLGSPAFFIGGLGVEGIYQTTYVEFTYCFAILNFTIPNV
jgi:hypothetical protein